MLVMLVILALVSIVAVYLLLRVPQSTTEPTNRHVHAGDIRSHQLL